MPDPTHLTVEEVRELVHCHNTSGHVGVLRCRKKWRAQITLDNKCVHIGVFDTKEEAIKARKDYAKDMWGEFAPQEVCHR